MGYALVLTENNFTTLRVNQNVTPANDLKINLSSIGTIAYIKVSDTDYIVDSSLIKPVGTLGYIYSFNLVYSGLSINSLTGEITVDSSWEGGSVIVKVSAIAQDGYSGTFSLSFTISNIDTIEGEVEPVENTITLTLITSNITAAKNTINTYSISTTGNVGTLTSTLDSDKFITSIDGSTLTVTTVEDNTTSSAYSATISVTGSNNVSATLSVSQPNAIFTIESELPTSVTVGNSVTVVASVSPIVESEPSIVIADESVLRITGATSEVDLNKTTYTITFYTLTAGSTTVTTKFGSQSDIVNSVTVTASTSSEIYITSATYDAANPVLNADGSGYYPLKITATDGQGHTFTFDDLSTYNNTNGAVQYTLTSLIRRLNIRLSASTRNHITGGDVYSNSDIIIDETTGQLSLPAISNGIYRHGSMTPKITLTPASGSGKSTVTFNNVMLSAGFCTYMYDTTNLKYTVTNNIEDPKVMFTNNSHTGYVPSVSVDYTLYKGLGFSSDDLGEFSSDASKSAINSIAVSAGDLIVVDLSGWNNVLNVDLRSGGIGSYPFLYFVESTVPLLVNGAHAVTKVPSDARVVSSTYGAEASAIYRVMNDGYFTFGMYNDTYAYEMHIAVISAS